VVPGPLDWGLLAALCGTKLPRQVEQVEGHLRQPWLVVLAALAARMAQAAAVVALATALTLSWEVLAVLAAQV